MKTQCCPLCRSAVPTWDGTVPADLHIYGMSLAQIRELFELKYKQDVGTIGGLLN